MELDYVGTPNCNEFCMKLEPKFVQLLNATFMPAEAEWLSREVRLIPLHLMVVYLRREIAH